MSTVPIPGTPNAITDLELPPPACLCGNLLAPGPHFSDAITFGSCGCPEHDRGFSKGPCLCKSKDALVVNPRCQEAWTQECEEQLPCNTCGFCPIHAYEANRQGDGSCPDCEEQGPEKEERPEGLTIEDKILLVRCLEAGIQKGKLKPYEAIRLADKLHLHVPSWVEAQAKLYERGIQP